MFLRSAIGVQRRVRLTFNTVCLCALTLLAGCNSPGADVVEAGAEGVRTIGESASFRGINGILFGPDGDLYLASVVTPAVARIDPESGEILDNWGLDDGAKSPDDLAFGPDGSVYWTDISNGEVAMRTATGETRVVASPGVGVNPITFSDDGRLFVSQCFMDTRLFELDPAGEAEPRVIRDDLGPGCGLNGMDWGSADGKLYGPRWFRGEVVRVDVDSGEMETVASDFGVPAAVKFNSEGVLHVLDSLRGEVVRIGSDGGKEVVARVQPGLDNFAFDADDRLFISSFADGFIVEALSPDENRMVLEGGLNMPGGAGAHRNRRRGPTRGRRLLRIAPARSGNRRRTRRRARRDRLLGHRNVDVGPCRGRRESDPVELVRQRRATLGSGGRCTGPDSSANSPPQSTRSSSRATSSPASGAQAT